MPEWDDVVMVIEISNISNFLNDRLFCLLN